VERGLVVLARGRSDLHIDAIVASVVKRLNRKVVDRVQEEMDFPVIQEGAVS